MNSRKKIQQKMIMVGSFTFISRILGILREFLLSHYLGATIAADVFFTAYKIPNSLRKIFAEGALTAAIVPTIVHTMHTKGQHAIAQLMSIAFLLFEGTLLIISGLAMYHAETIIRVIAGGFSEEKIALAIPLLQTLMPFIFFISSSALLAGALQSVNHFFVAAASPILLNIFFVGGSLICLYFDLPIIYLCWFILAGGAAQLLWHLIIYFRLSFTFGAIDLESFKQFKPVLIKFALCLPAASVEELNLFINTSFASYLPNGSISLLSYAHKFMILPLGVFGVAISTILLPHFTKISLYAPKRLSFYLFEATKLIIWLILPITIFMSIFSKTIFTTIFLSHKFTLLHAYEAADLLKIYLISLIFISLNKIMRNMFYSLHNTWQPALISIIAVIVNYVINKNFVHILQASGLALATSVSSIVQTILFVLLLKIQFNFKLYPCRIMQFFAYYCLQLGVLSLPFFGIYYCILKIISLQSLPLSHLLLDTVCIWFWLMPLFTLFLFTLFKLRHYFNIKLYFIN